MQIRYQTWRRLSQMGCILAMSAVLSFTKDMIPPSLPLTLYPKKTKTLMLLIVCLAFVAGSMLIIRKWEKVGWLCGGCFGLGIPVFLIQLWPKRAFLKVSEEGIEFCSLFSKQKVPWHDISQFGVITIRHHGLPVKRMVGLNYSAEFQSVWKARSVAKILTGFEGALPDTYGMGAEELAQILTDHHREWSLKGLAEPSGPADWSNPAT